MTPNPDARIRDRRRSAKLDVDRRAALKMFAAGAALAVTSCGRPAEEVVPYVEMPGRVAPGILLRFATTLPLGGYGRGVIVTSLEGRPIKIDGNPRHPASLGATDVFAEAELLSLYDPDRSKAPRTGTLIASWSAFEAALRPHLEREQARAGARFALLTGRVTSPTLVRQIRDLQRALPRARWYRYEPVDDDSARAGSMLAFGRPLTSIPRFGDVRVALMLDADPIGFGPEQIRFSRDLISARRSRTSHDLLRIYAAEPSWTLTGAAADHHISLHHRLIRNVALVVARELGAAVADAPLPPDAEKFARAAAADLKARKGEAIALAGRRQPAEVHALTHWINSQLQSPIGFIAPFDPIDMPHAQSLAGLASDIRLGEIETLIILGANPAYDGPGDLALGDAIRTVPFTVHLGSHDDETAAYTSWYLPLSHPLESWSDLRAFDGTASIVQPLIRPLYDTRTAHDVLALLGGAATSSRDLVRETWSSYWRDDVGRGEYEAWWRASLEDGVVANSASAAIEPPTANLPQVMPANASEGLTVILAPDPVVWDGSRANNAWLQ